ncbi:MAG: TrmB family transcriptional regulator [Halobellus sp.]|uniref:TrmB family transcriptional regulator n=1 Tax=Halobellus sp. TaxID=1979212 RepID=UPI0035D4CF77
MSIPELTSSQKRILRSLVDLSSEMERAVQGKVIAEDIDRNPGTIRNQMQSLRALQLVEGIPGPKGGYKPTTNAYEALDVETMDEAAQVPVERNGGVVDGINVEEIYLGTVHHPDLCRAAVTLRGSIRRFSESDRVTVGPTPSTGLRLSGTVKAVNADESTLILSVGQMNTAAEQSAG